MKKSCNESHFLQHCARLKVNFPTYAPMIVNTLKMNFPSSAPDIDHPGDIADVGHTIGQAAWLYYLYTPSQWHCFCQLHQFISHF